MKVNARRSISVMLWTLFILCHHALADESVSTIIEFPMDSNPGWSVEGQWEFGVPLGDRGDPTSGFTGTNVYGYNLQGDYANNMPRYWLTTTAIDCSQYHDVTLSFYRWLSIENANFDKASIEVSNDGSTWHIIWSHDSIEIKDTSWQHISYNISHIADAESTVFIRWGIGPTDSLSKGAGWNIDDVMLKGVLADPLDISPVNTWEVYGHPGGPFAPETTQFTLINTSTDAIRWSATASASWLALTPTNGTLDAAASTNVVLSLLSSATNLAEGVHRGTLVFSNLTSGQIHRRNIELTVQPMTGSIVNAGGYSQTLNLDSDTSGNIRKNSNGSIGVLMMRTMYNDIFTAGIGEAILPLTNTYSGSLGTNITGSSTMPADNSGIRNDRLLHGIGTLAKPEVNTFTNDGGDPYWTNAANWNVGIPSVDLPAEFETLSGLYTTVVDTVAYAREIIMYASDSDTILVSSGGDLSTLKLMIGTENNTGGTLEIDGGTVTVSEELALAAKNAGSTGTIVLKNGRLDFLGNTEGTLDIGRGGAGKLLISGGVMNAADTGVAMRLGAKNGSLGEIIMTGGELRVNRIEAGLLDNADSALSLLQGVLILEDSTTNGFTYGSTTVLMEKGMIQWRLNSGVEIIVEDLISAGDLSWQNGWSIGTFSTDYGYDFRYLNDQGTDYLYVKNAGLNDYSMIWVEQVPEPAVASLILVFGCSMLWIKKWLEPRQRCDRICIRFLKAFNRCQS